MKHAGQSFELNDSDIEVMLENINEPTTITPARDFVSIVALPKSPATVSFPPKPAMDSLKDAQDSLVSFLKEADRALRAGGMLIEQRSIITSLIASVNDHVKQLEYVRMPRFIRRS